MKNRVMDKVLAASADFIIETLIASAGLPSAGGIYQPKEPDGLKALIKEKNLEK